MRGSRWNVWRSHLPSLDTGVRQVFRIAVIVVGFNSKRWLEECFTAIRADAPEGTLMYFVDNASTDDSVGLVRRKFPEVIIVVEAFNRGFSGGNNVAFIRAFSAGAKHVILLNPDTRCKQGFISGSADFLEQHPEFGIIGPIQLSYNSESPVMNRWSRRVLVEGNQHPLHDWLPAIMKNKATPWSGELVVDCTYVQGAAMALSANLVAVVGGFDELFPLFFEEADLCRRARWAGFRVGIVTTLEIEHQGRGVRDGDVRRVFHRIKGRYVYLLTDPELKMGTIVLVLLNWIVRDLTGCLLGRNHDGPVTLATYLRAVLGICKRSGAIRNARQIRTMEAWRT